MTKTTDLPGQDNTGQGNPGQQRILITGIGLLSGLGIGQQDTWDKVAAGGSAVVKKETWDVKGLTSELFGVCADFNFQDYFADIPAPLPWRYSQLAMMACKLALEDAGLSLKGTDTSRIGLVINSDLGATKAAEEYALKLYGKGPERVSPFEFTKSVANCVIGDVARYFNITGASSFIIGEHSISYGYDLLRSGKADIVICGCFDEVRDRTVWNYKQRGLLAEYGPDDQEGRMIFGEGSGFLILENEDHALGRKAKVYAAVAGEYSGCDSLCNELLWERNTEDLSLVMSRALASSGLNTDDISFVMGSSCMPWQTASYEMPAIRSIWGEQTVPYTTTKPRTGESFASGQTLSFALAALALHHRLIPGTGWAGGNAAYMVCDNRAIVSETASCLVNSIQVGGNTTTFILSSC